jgi:fluoroquinolone transport system permease protein
MTAFKSDMKMILREPIMLIFLILPLFISFIFRLLAVFAFPYIKELTGFDIAPYNGYVLSAALLMTPMMLGTVSGFLMIDERDCHVLELMAVTPAGFGGYVFNRLLIPFTGSIAYTFASYFILNIHQVNFLVLILISLFIGINSMLTGILLYLLAQDKVKGLAYAKGLGVLILLAMADLLGIGWLKVLASIIPHYWIVRIVTGAPLLKSLIAAALIHLAYGAVIIPISKKAF